ncbi:hypothetical protein HMPREF9318_02108 [Streptococcus urinalis FB127-CNA-2]|uniref:hypothetical protein n=1 Tax=Streptococcus urinalis TaxID=149016 RepID=UPI000225DABC|nr:hypothetical protein [Streptococcus urinalis]EKS17231.1 hypothetical protein HMPREF9318_02108 [Streptococcus urinalis FB127-CNA-2]VEF32519.1 putative bacteriocin self-immunity protein [Streptococcus urinalis]
MRNIFRFLSIITISGLVLIIIGSLYHLSFNKNILLICWSLMLELLVFIFVSRTSKEILSLHQIIKQFWLFIKNTVLIPILVTILLIIGHLTRISELLIYFYLHIIVVCYTVGMITSLSCSISPKHSIFNKFKKESK